MGTMWERLLTIEEHFLQLAGLLFQVSCLFYFGGVMLTAASKNSTYGEKNHFLCFPFSLLFICFTLRSLYSPPNRGFLNKQIILPPQSQFWRKCCSVCVCVCAATFVQQRLHNSSLLYVLGSFNWPFQQCSSSMMLFYVPLSLCARCNDES